MVLALLAACNRGPEWTKLRRVVGGEGHTFAVEPRFLNYSSRVTAAAARVGGPLVLTGQRLVMVSRDDGRTWKTGPCPILDAKAVLISNDGSRFFVYGNYDFGRYGGDAIFESRDDGTSFKQLLSVSEGTGGEVLDMGLSNDQQTLFVLTTGNILHRSDDDGANWSTIELGGCGTSFGRIAVSPKGPDTAVLGCDAQVYLLRGKNPPRRIRLAEHRAPYSISFTRDGAALKLQFSKTVRVGRGKSSSSKTSLSEVEVQLASGVFTSRSLPEPPQVSNAKPRMCKYDSDPYPPFRLTGNGEEWGFRTDGRLMAKREPDPDWHETPTRLMACDGSTDPDRATVQLGSSLIVYGDGSHCLGALGESKDQGINWESKYQGGTVSAVARTSDGSILLADGAALRLRQASGDVFQDVALPSQAKGVGNWQLYCQETSHECWAGGERATILHSTDDGRHFSFLQSLPNGAQISLIMANRDASRIVMGSNSSLVYESRDHGHHFTPIELGESVRLNAGAASSDHIWLAVGDDPSEGASLITVSGTKAPYELAKRKVSNGSSSNIALRHLWQSVDGALWVRGSEGEILRSIDGGENFSLVANERSLVQMDRDAHFASWASLKREAIETVSWAFHGGVALLKGKRLPMARGIRFQWTKERVAWVADVDAGEFDPVQTQLTSAVYIDGTTKPFECKVVRTSLNPLRFELQPAGPLPGKPSASRVRVTIGLKDEPFYREAFEAKAVPLRCGGLLSFNDCGGTRNAFHR